ncbi:MAG: hypothetical protein KC466_06315, partial [Myxococcales bacterium]|nr:hypothetical protein [Myxococcales bacterium]
LWGVVDLARRRPARIPAWAAENYPPVPERMVDDPFDKLPEPEAPWEEYALRVRRSDLDLNDHANSGAYFDWCLESVPAEFWRTHVCRSFEIHYKREANWRERLTSRTATGHAAETTPPGETILAHAIVRAEDGEVLTLARSRWRAR